MHAMLKKPVRRGLPMARSRAVRGGWQKLEVYSGAGGLSARWLACYCKELFTLWAPRR